MSWSSRRSLSRNRLMWITNKLFTALISQSVCLKKGKYVFSLSNWLVSLSIDHIVSSPVLSSPSQGAGSFVLFDTALCCTCCIKSHHTPSVNCVYLSMNPYSRPQWLRSPKGRFCWMPQIRNSFLSFTDWLSFRSNLVSERSSYCLDSKACGFWLQFFLSPRSFSILS